MFLTIAYMVVLFVMDSTGRQWRRCTVDSTEVRPGSRFGSPYVQLSTSCGKLALDKGVGLDKADEVAREFTPGTGYDFKLARTARHPGWWLGDTTVHDWRRV
ncbi:hypothetical protein GCM10011575_27330 [Microlunatus endophyticus]|uniref:Uncharacterized protein n=1 Tax=Microlunatus endophyticus TaxID=1716077 RepID=A0A917SBW1_9ACTN|nr:hypothetical protein [Microlunatus endophyticus]GGL67369.1 hypothetical protein GCM10011575_27330 [Microlunatus endophyticus]